MFLSAIVMPLTEFLGRVAADICIYMVCACVCACVRVCARACVHACMRACARACARARVCARACVYFKLRNKNLIFD